MTQYLVAIFHPDDYDPAVAEDEAMDRDIDVLNDEMQAAGVRVFVGGLTPIGKAVSVRKRANGEMFTTDGPTSRRRNISAAFGYWRLPISTRQ